MLQYLLLSLLVSTPDPSTRTHAWRVVDQVSGNYRCEYACSTTAVDAARDTACIQAALDVASAGGKYVALELPKGVCRINAQLKVPVEPGTLGSLEIYGQGAPWTTNRSNFGDGSWTAASFRGTVLYSELSSGAILTLGTDETITASNPGTDVITLSSATHFAVDDWVTFRNDLDSAQPAGISVGTGYYVKSVSGDDITISLTDSGGANLTLDITASGTGTTHITNSPGGRWIVRDLAIMGFGGTSRTTKGLQIVGGSGIALIDLQGVTFANLGVGLDLGTVEDGAARSLAFYGNLVGFLGDGHTNSNLFTATDCSGNTSCGILKGSTNSFFGGTVQGSLNYGLRFLGGENQVTGVYFEDLTTTGAAISDERSSSWIVRSIAGATLTLDGPAPVDNTTVYVWVDGSSSVIPTSVPATVAGTVYHVWGSSGRTCTLRTATAGGGSELVYSDSGTGNVRMTASTAEAGYNVFVNNHYGPSGDDVSLWKNNATFRNPTMPNATTIQKGTSAVTVEQPQACVDGGVGSYCQSFNNGGIHLSFTNPVVASPGLFLETAAALYFNLHTASGLNFNWECRDALGYCQFRDATNDVAFLAINPNGAGAGDNEVEVKAATLTVEGGQTIVGSLACDVITEQVAASGVTIDGTLIKDGLVDGVDVSVLNAYVAPCTAVGDGVTDDTATIQACIDGTPIGGTLFLPEGVYLITAGLTVANAIEIVGQGAASNTTSEVYAFGNASWASATFRGTVLKSALASGTMLAMVNNDPRFIVRNVAFWGTDDGADSTLIGLSMTTNGGQAPRPIIENVSAFNLKTGIKCTTCTAGSLRDIYLAGNSVGLELSASSDAGNVILNPRVVTNVTGVLLTGALNTNIVGGYFSANTTGIDLLGARASTITGAQFTGNTAGMVIEKSGGGGTGSGGDQNTIRGCQFVTNDPVSVYGSGNHFEVTGITNSPAITLQSGAAYNYVEYLGGVGGSYTDSSGQQNFKIYQSANGLEFYDSAMVSFEDGMVTATSATIGGASIAAGDFSTAATGDYVATDHINELTSANGVYFDADTAHVKDGVVYAAGGFQSQGDPSAVYCNVNDAGNEWEMSSIDIAASNYLKTDTINEHTAAAGVAVEGVLLKDHAITIDGTGGGNVSRVLYQQYLTETTEGTSQEDLKTVSIPAGTMAANGDSIEVDAWVECDADANSKTATMYFNGSTFETNTRSPCVSETWHLHGVIMRIDSTHMAWMGKLDYSNTVGSLHTYTGDTITWANAQDFTIRATTPTQAGDVTLYRLSLKYVPAVTP